MRKLAIGGKDRLTDLAVTALSMGCTGLGNLFNAVSDETAISTVERAVDAGINFFDVAPHYGGGVAERRLGNALKLCRDADVIISTKVGRLVVPEGSGEKPVEHNYVDVPPNEIKYDYSYGGIMQSWRDSLQRLGVETIDILLVHDLGAHGHKDPGSEVQHFHDVTDGGGFDALIELRDKGLIKAFGLGVMDEEIPLKVIERGVPINCLMYANRYNILEHSTALSELLPVCQDKGISILAGGVFASGCLAGGNTYMYSRDLPEDVMQKLLFLKTACDRFDVNMRAAAVQFALAHPSVDTACLRMSAPSEVEANVSLLTHKTPSEFWDALRDRQIIDERAPTPRPMVYSRPVPRQDVLGYD